MMSMPTFGTESLVFDLKGEKAECIVTKNKSLNTSWKSIGSPFVFFLRNLEVLAVPVKVNSIFIQKTGKYKADRTL